jgi:hypothetical protein
LLAGEIRRSFIEAPAGDQGSFISKYGLPFRRGKIGQLAGTAFPASLANLRLRTKLYLTARDQPCSVRARALIERS